MGKSGFEDFSGGGGGYDAVVVGSGYGGSVAACRMSMAGLKVCLLEKGRRWDASDFPTNGLEMLSAVRMENRNLGLNFGPKDALFQVYLSTSIRIHLRVFLLLELLSSLLSCFLGCSVSCMHISFSSSSLLTCSML